MTMTMTMTMTMLQSAQAGAHSNWMNIATGPSSPLGTGTKDSTMTQGHLKADAL